MKIVYNAANVIDAHLVRHALEDAGIPVFIRGEALTGGMGELPMYGMVQVCVPESAWPEADAVVRGLDFGEAPGPGRRRRLGRGAATGVNASVVPPGA